LLNIGNTTLESESPKIFSIRLHELVSLKCSDIPKDIELIVQDTAMSPYKRIVDVKTIIESIGWGACLLAIEEYSDCSRWVRREDMESYYNARKCQLLDRQESVFDVGLRYDQISDESFIIRYLLLPELESTELIIMISDLIIQTVAESVADFNICES